MNQKDFEILEQFKRPIKLKEKVEDICTYYGPKTLVSGWYMPASSHPFDNKCQDQRISTYNRLGTLEEPFPKSVSKTDLESVLIYPPSTKPANVYKPLINLISFPTTLGKKREEGAEVAGIKVEHPNINKTDYRTVTSCDYVYPFPRAPRFVSREDYYRIETKFRRGRTDPMDDRRSGCNKFFDDNLDKLVAPKPFEKISPPFSYNFPPEETWARIKQDRMTKK